MTIALSHPDSESRAKRVRLLNVRISLPLGDEALACLEGGELPLIGIYVGHTGSKILNDAAFEEGVRSVLSSIIDKPVKVKLFEDQYGDEGDAIMDPGDDESAWNLAAYVLAKNGYNATPDSTTAE